MATVKIPPVLRAQTGGESPGPARGRRRRRGPARLSPGAIRAPRSSSSTPTAQLNRYVNIYLNDEDVRVLDGLDTCVSESDTIVILPAMAGGAG